MVSLEYIDKLHHESVEVGNVTSSDLVKILVNAPISDSPTYFCADFRASKGAIPETLGELLFDAGNIFLGNVKYLYYVRGREEFDAAIRGGKLEELKIDFPGYEGGVEDLMMGGKALGSFRGVLGTLMDDNGYELLVPSFKVAHYVVQTKTQHPGFFSKSISGKISLSTSAMVKGQEPRKLVFSYTRDVMETPEFNAYKSLISEIEAKK